MAVFAWQGWRLETPSRWSPVKLDGDRDEGYALFADLHRPRLGLRWKKLGKRTRGDDWARLAMRNEVGSLALDEAKRLPDGDRWHSAMLFIDPEPPGRDVWVGVSARSGRAVQLIHHAHRRERLLAEVVLPTLEDLPTDEPMPWSVFELSCVVPPGMELTGKKLLAGDLMLLLTDKKRQVRVRQVAVAQLALQRLPLGKWLDQQLRERRKHYRPLGPPEPVELSIRGKPVAGLARCTRRRRRFFFQRWLAPRIVSYALHDAERDRLVFVESNDRELAEAVAATVGWAAAGTRE